MLYIYQYILTSEDGYPIKCSVLAVCCTSALTLQGIPLVIVCLYTPPTLQGIQLVVNCLHILWSCCSASCFI